MRVIKIGKTNERNLWYLGGKWAFEDRDEEIRTSQFKLVSPAGHIVMLAMPDGTLEWSFGSKYNIERRVQSVGKGNAGKVGCGSDDIALEEILLDIQEILGWKGFRFSAKASEYMSDDAKAWGKSIVERLTVGSDRDDDSCDECGGSVVV